jgi:hypothetical protein
MSRSKKRPPAPPAKPKAKRGRPRKAAVPPVAPPIPVTLHQAMQAVLDDAKQRAATGKAMQHHHHQALRTAWMLDQAQYVWESVDACAAELSVSPGTVRGYAAAGCDAIKPHEPIKKHALYAWLLQHAHERGGKRGTTINDNENLEAEWLRSKLLRLNNSLVTEAEDRACQGTITRAGQLRHFLQNGLPGVVLEIARKHADRSEAEDAIAQAIAAELRRFEPTRADTTATTAHDAQTTTAPAPSEPAHG